MRNTRVFSGSAHPLLAAAIVDKLGLQLSPAKLKTQQNKEISLDLSVSVRNQDVFIVQSGSPSINDNLVELLVFISACKLSSARRITAVLPYYPYTKQCKKKKTRSTITAKLVANMLTVAGVDHIITMDLHDSAMQGFFARPVDNLVAEPNIARYITQSVPDYATGVVVSKNAGAAKRVTSFADRLELDFALILRETHHIPKAAAAARRISLTEDSNPGNLLVDDEDEEEEEESPPVATRDEDVLIKITLVGNVQDKPCFLVDDFIDHPTSFISAAKHLRKCGATRVYVIATHCALTEDGLQELEDSDDVHQLVVTNTYPFSASGENITGEAELAAFCARYAKLRVIDVSNVLAEAIRRTHNGESVSYLFHTPM